MKNVYYVKANKKIKWIGEYENGFDWYMIGDDRKKKEVLFPDGKKFEYFIEAGEGDILILHSVMVEINGKLKPMPRIVGIGIISKRRHFDAKEGKKGCYLTEFRKVIELSKPILVKDIKDKIPNAEPYKLGSNRCAITKLDADEYNIIKKVILSRNLEIKSKIYAIENAN